jgi:hypothetical protein
MLAINAARTILRYVDGRARVHGHESKPRSAEEPFQDGSAARVAMTWVCGAKIPFGHGLIGSDICVARARSPCAA